MPGLSTEEQIALNQAFNEINRERRLALQAMFFGTQLVLKDKGGQFKTLAAEAKTVQAKVQALPNITLPMDLGLGNLTLFRGLDFPDLLTWPSIGRVIPELTGLSLNLPTLELKYLHIRCPSFNLTALLAKLKPLYPRLTLDVLGRIRLRILIDAIALNFPDIRPPFLIFNLCQIFDIPLLKLLPDFEVAFPNFLPSLPSIELPHLVVPHVNFPDLPTLTVPEIDLAALQLPGLPGLPNMDILRRLPGFDSVLRLLFECFDTLDFKEIIAVLGPDFLSDFISSALPIVQQVKSGATAASSWGKAASDWHKARRVQRHAAFIMPGAAQDACRAIERLLLESRASNTSLAAIQTTQFFTSTGGLFLDAGTVTGPAVAAAAAVAKTCHTIMFMGHLHKQFKQANHILRTSPADKLSSNLFEVSPLLGCYYIANSTTSTVLNIMSRNIIEDHWMDEWEKNKREHLDPLIASAQRFIDESRYGLRPIRQNKGMYLPLGRVDKLKTAAALYAKKKLGVVPASTPSPTQRYIG